MHLKDFTDEQGQALLDLATLAMYADGHLAAVEDERVQRLLVAMGFATGYDRSKQYDASVSRVSRHSATAAAARTYATTLARSFASREQRRRVHDLLDDLMSSDSSIAPQESTLLAVVKEALQM
jgi:uncharacterized tellurite resistance protein B-like protein